MITLADIHDHSVADQIHHLQRAAYSVEAALIGSHDFPPLCETQDELFRSPDCFLVFVENGTILGCLSYEPPGTVVTITRLVVSPSNFRRGIATALLRDLERRLPAGSLICATTADLNEPAIKAYEKQGYQTTPGPLSEGITLRRVEKRVDGTLAASKPIKT